MIRHILSGFLLVISVHGYGQAAPLVNYKGSAGSSGPDPLYFILGTLSDYLGRFTYVDKESQIDRYYPFEKPLIEFLGKFAGKEYDTRVISNPDNETEISLYETFSSGLSSEINSYFNNNHLILDRLEDLPELNCSYIAGRYYRYGRKINNSLYMVQLANSADHVVCDSLLRRAGCAEVHFSYRKTIPAQFIYYFTPAPGLKKYLDTVEDEKAKLQASYRLYLKARLKLTGRHMRMYDKSVRKADSEIIDLFKDKGK